MKRSFRLCIAASLPAAAAIACSSAAQAGSRPAVERLRVSPALLSPALLSPALLSPALLSPALLSQTLPSPAFHARADTGRQKVNAADVHFMSGMIPHHAQAVLIAGWAPSHGASSSLRILCERIVVAQRDEIDLMQNWLRDRRQPVPAANAMRMKMIMDGVEHDMLMPGMLTDEELAQLDRATGTEFERLFLQAMIRHHEGAISMVDQLFGAHGAGQDEVVFRFASDVYADQTTEIDRMQKMLAALPAGSRNP